MQDVGQQQHLEREGQGRGIVKLRTAAAIRHDGGGSGQHRALGGEQVEQAEDAPLREHGEGQQQQHRGGEMDELGGPRQVGHAQLPSSSRTKSPSTASRNAVARNSGARKMRILALTVSSSARPAPAAANLSATTGRAASIPEPTRSGSPQGRNSAKPMAQ